MNFNDANSTGNNLIKLFSSSMTVKQNKLECFCQDFKATLRLLNKDKTRFYETFFGVCLLKFISKDREKCLV
jgi:hypothetical protein